MRDLDQSDVMADAERLKDQVADEIIKKYDAGHTLSEYEEWFADNFIKDLRDE